MGGSQGHELWLCLQFKHLQTVLICELALSVVRVTVVLVPAGLTSPDFFCVYGSSAKQSVPGVWLDQEGAVDILILPLSQQPYA